MAERRASTLALTATAAFSTAGWVTLHALNRGALAGPPLAHASQWMAWMAVRPADVAAFAVLGVVAQAMAAYLTLIIVVGTFARLLSLGTLARAFDRATVPAVRRLLAAAVGASIVAVPLTSLPAGADPAGSSPPIMRALPTDATTTVVPPVMRRLPAETTTTTRPPVTTPSTVPPTSARPPATQPAAPMPTASTVTIAPGGNLWQVASDALAVALHRTPADREVAPYWLRVIEANRVHLAHVEDPNLVYAGQVIELPSIDPTG